MFNFTNPGCDDRCLELTPRLMLAWTCLLLHPYKPACSVVSHNEVLELYKSEIDPTFWYANFSEEEQAKILVSAGGGLPSGYLRRITPRRYGLRMPPIRAESWPLQQPS